MAGKTTKSMGVSPITNTIYYGKINKEKSMWVGNKEDVTDMAIAAVFEWFLNQMDGKEEFIIAYPNIPNMKLKMVREEEKDTQTSIA